MEGELQALKAGAGSGLPPVPMLPEDCAPLLKLLPSLEPYVRIAQPQMQSKSAAAAAPAAATTTTATTVKPGQQVTAQPNGLVSSAAAAGPAIAPSPRPVVMVPGQPAAAVITTAAVPSLPVHAQSSPAAGVAAVNAAGLSVVTSAPQPAGVVVIGGPVVAAAASGGGGGGAPLSSPGARPPLAPHPAAPSQQQQQQQVQVLPTLPITLTHEQSAAISAASQAATMQYLTSQGFKPGQNITPTALQVRAYMVIIHS